ncbi:MAG: TIGR03960 family B12-binding radical SAM protein [Deltaproteobacteria bacterium]|nr:TIGR03960 family B12-binding radical SAM protein [Deltaproteobacteria bacterium]
MSTSLSFHEHPYAGFLHTVEKPARYVGGEFGQIRKSWDQVRAHVCLAFPDIYDIGMSHLGTRILYKVLNAESDILCERAFAPWHDMEKELRARSLPIVSLESARPLREFDVVGISLQHELVFSNALTLLDLGGIPLRASERAESDPLVLGGGSIATHPEPMAPFFDAFVVGDGEQKAVEVARRWAEDRDAGLSRQARLRRLAALGGVYVPALYSTRADPQTGRIVVDRPLFDDVPLPVRRAFVADLDSFPFPEQFPVGGPEAVFERLSIEIARGCMQGCRFCQAGMIFRPQRDRDPARLAELIGRAVSWAGEDEVALTSLSTADYPHVGELIGELSDRLGPCNVALGVSSLRAYGLTDEVLDQIRKVRATGLTFAPEAGSQRMRDLINKNITEEQIFATAERVLTRGWDRLKFYFMIGLPTETEQDVLDIVETTARAREAGRRGRGKGRPPKVTASVSTFAPKPHTPLQWERMLGPQEVIGRQHMLKDRARARNVDLKVHPMHGSILEGLLCRGDRRLADVIETAWRNGARFDAWESAMPWDTWMAAVRACEVDLDSYLAELPIDSTLPWAHIDVGVAHDFLLKERDKARKGKLTPVCGRPYSAVEGREPSNDKLVCFHCGAGCDLETMAVGRKRSGEKLAALRARPHEQEKVEPPPQIEPVRYRIRFEKLGKASLLGHLDLVRELPRVLRRAGMPLWYSQGFHPKAVMSFAPALSLGVPSFDEYVDVKTSTEIDVVDVVQRLATLSQEGLRFLEISRLQPGAPAIGAEIVAARYLLGLPPELQSRALAVVGDRSWEQVVATRTKGDVERSFPLREYVESVEPGDASDVETLARAGIRGTWAPVRVVLRVLPSGVARLQEVADALCGQAETDFRAVRMELRLKS